ncbi:MAG: hypothetical protein A2536_05155 [Candidatus Firestonebacteria bacterium RIFOXYD2_FULL_39_29]|nr:MAG: hypothetical protein A2536_05155 [Candidatus Firestonebacteria bacterium RIFOXYD2_FULL_39_29]
MAKMKLREKIRKGWELFKVSWKILRENKKLIVFPLLTAGAFILFVAGVAPLLYSIYSNHLLKPLVGTQVSSHISIFQFFQSIGWKNFSMLFLLSLGISWLSIYINATFLSCVIDILRENKTSISASFKKTWALKGKIFQWAIVSSIVLTVLMTIEAYAEKLPFIGRWIGRAISFLGGLAWAIGTYFVIPVLVNEDIGIIDSVKRSAELIKRTWGETTSGYIIFEIVKDVFVCLPAFLMLAATVIYFVISFTASLSSNGVSSFIPNKIISIIIFMLPIAWAIAAGLVYTVLNKIFNGAIYIYASEGVVPEGFNKELLDSSWQVK